LAASKHRTYVYYLKPLAKQTSQGCQLKTISVAGQPKAVNWKANQLK